MEGVINTGFLANPLSWLLLGVAIIVIYFVRSKGRRY